MARRIAAPAQGQRSRRPHQIYEKVEKLARLTRALREQCPLSWLPVLGIAVRMTCECAEQVGLLLQLIQPMVQDIANADHSDKVISIFDGQVANVSRQHR